jgi:O-antigen/teichoic acid export membrane protein
MAKLLATLPVDKVSVVLNQLASPILAGLQADRTAMRDSFLRTVRIAACFTVPSCMGMGLAADDLVYVALGEKWLPIVPILQVLSLFGLVHSLAVLFPPVLFARYRTMFLFYWTGALLLVMPFAFWAGAAWGEALGVALASVIIYPIFVALLAREGLRQIETRYATFWRHLRPVAAGVLPMIACMLIVQWAMPNSDFVERLTRLALTAGLGGLVYALAILWLGGPLVGEIAQIAGWLLPRWRSLTATK